MNEKFDSFIDFASSHEALWQSIQRASNDGLIIVDEENDAITATNRLLWVYPGIHEALNVIINQWVDKNMDTKTNFNNLIKDLEKVEEDND